MRWGNPKVVKDITAWRRWFAWHPVKFSTLGTWVWWEWIQRRGTVISDAEDNSVTLWWYK